jgi:2-polyprenyl-3-methyl-5-hydroxy-6-metoxy-1,4-benzoquinol methylase
MRREQPPGHVLRSPTSGEARFRRLEKPPSYYSVERAELTARLPRPLGAVLDVGCGAGASGGALRAAGAASLTGIELDPTAAAAAEAVYDTVHVGRAEEVLPELDGRFDTILLYDALEHMADPDVVLRGLAAVSTAGARLHVSVPNARHWSLVRDLVLRGTFGYAAWGHRDSTHVRWFTRRDLVELLRVHGWETLEVSHGTLRPASRALARLTRGRSAEFLVYQLAVLAQRDR